MKSDGRVPEGIPRSGGGVRVRAMRTGIVIEVNAADRARLEAVVADRNSPQKHVWRARIVLLTAAGVGTTHDPWRVTRRVLEPRQPCTSGRASGGRHMTIHHDGLRPHLPCLRPGRASAPRERQALSSTESRIKNAGFGGNPCAGPWPHVANFGSICDQAWPSPRSRLSLAPGSGTRMDSVGIARAGSGEAINETAVMKSSSETVVINQQYCAGYEGG
jgi:hypothetical protein